MKLTLGSRAITLRRCQVHGIELGLVTMGEFVGPIRHSELGLFVSKPIFSVNQFTVGIIGTKGDCVIIKV